MRKEKPPRGNSVIEAARWLRDYFLFKQSISSNSDQRPKLAFQADQPEDSSEARFF